MNTPNPSKSYRTRQALRGAFGSLDKTTIWTIIGLLILIGWTADNLLAFIISGNQSPATLAALASICVLLLYLAINHMHKQAQQIAHNSLIESTTTQPKRLDPKHLILIVSTARHIGDIKDKLDDTQKKKLDNTHTQEELETFIQTQDEEAPKENAQENNAPTSNTRKKYQWYMPYKTIKNHQPKHIYPIFTAGEKGSSPQKDVFLKLFQGIFPAINFEAHAMESDLSSLATKYDEIKRSILKKGYRPNQILVDITGGQASMSAMLAVNSTIDDVIVSYVDTNDYKIHYFDFRSESNNDGA